MAMAEATKLFDNSGGAASGNKQDAVNGAAMTVMKLLVQSKFSAATGGSNSGGLCAVLLVELSQASLDLFAISLSFLVSLWIWVFPPSHSRGGK